MATMTELLGALNTKEAEVTTAELAKDLKSSTEGTLKQLTREKDKGNVAGSSQEGWRITETGRKALEKGDLHPSMLDEGVTPRQQFEAIGRRIGIKEDRIALATDIVWSGDYNDITWVWQALGQADIADDLRSVWVNAWRAKLHKGIPPELEPELTGVSKVEAEEKGSTRSKNGDRDYIIVDDEPVRVGENLGDYSLADAKDILSIRAIRMRFSEIGRAGTRQGESAGIGGTGEKVSDLLRELSPYLNKDSNGDSLKELIATQMELQRVEILSHIPAQGNPPQPKSFIEQITEFATAMGTLKEAGPTIRSMLGIQESPGNPSTGVPVRVQGPDGQPVVMDLGMVIDWRKFQNEERRADEKHSALIGMAQTVRENLGDGIAALKSAAVETKESGEDKKTPPDEKQQVFRCGDCQMEFSAPPGWEGQTIKCPNPVCGREYSKDELLG